MTKDITQQARKEAEEKYLFPDDDHPSQDEDYTVTDIVLAEREAYAAALIHERSKPNPLHEELGFARIEIDALKARLKGCEDALEQRDAKPSLMVGFSEEEVRLIADEVAEDCGVDDETEYGAYTWKCMLECAMKVHEAHAANTRAVSIDRIMEVVREATWINDVDLLRERLMKITP